MTALSVCVLIFLLLVSCVMSVLSQKGFAYTVVVIENDTRLGMEHLVFDKWLQNSRNEIRNKHFTVRSIMLDNDFVLKRIIP